MFQGIFKSVSKKFNEDSYKGVVVSLKGISSSFKGGSRVLERSSTGVSWKFQ